MDTAIEVTITEQGRAFWLGQGLAHENFEKVSSADVLIVPLKDFRSELPFAFHSNTAMFARFLARNLAGQAKIEVLADDDEYIEISLHSKEIRISTIIVTAVVVPLLVNLLSSYIYDELKAKPNDSVEMSLVIEDQNCRSLHIGFHGNAKEFPLFADKVTQISRECVSTNTKAIAAPASTGETQATDTGSQRTFDEQF